jgi:hypothetical protein
MNIGSNELRQEVLPAISTFVLKTPGYAYSLESRNFYALPQEPHRAQCRLENPA